MPTNNNFGILNTGIIDFAGATSPGWVSNLGCTLSAGTFTITDAGGAALSATNPGWVTLPSQTAGRLVSIKVTANQDFIDDSGASEIITNIFGVTSGIAWADDCPFYIYAVPNDAETAIAFMISRIPHATRSPVQAAIGAPDDAVADDEGDFFSFDNLDETLYDENPCLCIGSIRMRMTASDDWTVQTLTDQDGIGRFHFDTFFTFPLNQNGAEANTYIAANGGTAPTFGTTQYVYRFSPNGNVEVFADMSVDSGTDGIGAVESRFSLPVLAGPTGFTELLVNSNAYTETATGGLRTTSVSISNATTYFRLYEADLSTVQNGDFTNGGRQVSTHFIYAAVNASTA